MEGSLLLAWWIANRMPDPFGDQMMTLSDWLTTPEIGEIFAEEMVIAGGNVSDRFDDGTRLFLRAVLPDEREVRSGDRLRAGVAVRATPEEISVHPYVFRQVCSNGAILAHATQSRRIERNVFLPGDGPEVEVALREAVRACCLEDAFASGFDEIRSSLDSTIDLALTMMPLMSRLAEKEAGHTIFQTILNRFFESRDTSRFGWMNAVTSVARDTTDPEVRWRLEEFGGGIPVAAEKAGRQRGRVREPILLGA
jgi:hypothetical protein